MTFQDLYSTQMDIVLATTTGETYSILDRQRAVNIAYNWVHGVIHPVSSTLPFNTVLPDMVINADQPWNGQFAEWHRVVLLEAARYLLYLEENQEMIAAVKAERDEMLALWRDQQKRQAQNYGNPNTYLRMWATDASQALGDYSQVVLTPTARQNAVNDAYQWVNDIITPVSATYAYTPIVTALVSDNDTFWGGQFNPWLRVVALEAAHRLSHALNDPALEQKLVAERDQMLSAWNKQLKEVPIIAGSEGTFVRFWTSDLSRAVGTYSQNNLTPTQRKSFINRAIRDVHREIYPTNDNVNTTVPTSVATTALPSRFAQFSQDPVLWRKTTDTTWTELTRATMSDLENLTPGWDIPGYALETPRYYVFEEYPAGVSVTLVPAPISSGYLRFGFYDTPGDLSSDADQPFAGKFPQCTDAIIYQAAIYAAQAMGDEKLEAGLISKRDRAWRDFRHFLAWRAQPTPRVVTSPRALYKRGRKDSRTDWDDWNA